MWLRRQPEGEEVDCADAEFNFEVGKKVLCGFEWVICPSIGITAG